MYGSIRLSAKERKTLLQIYRAAPTARRALILLHLSKGWSYRQIMEALLVSPAMSATEARLLRGRRGPGAGRRVADRGRAFLADGGDARLLGSTPQDFGFFRSRRSCAVLSLLLWQRQGIRLSPETMRRGLHRMEVVWRWPRPVVGWRNPAADRRSAVRRDGRLSGRDGRASDPKIGSCWMRRRGQQAEVVTPGNNEKRRMAGSLHGRLLLSPPSTRRNAELFVAHLEDFRCRLRSFRVIHVVCYNARFHDCRAAGVSVASWRADSTPLPP